MEWFGWLTKGHYQVSMLDGVVVFVAAYLEIRRDKKLAAKVRT
jgi:hypothetical protein